MNSSLVFVNLLTLRIIWLKPIVFLSILSLVSSCKETSRKVENSGTWTEEQKRNYFSDSLSGSYGFGHFMEGDSTKTFKYFFKTQYPDIKTKIPFDAFPYAFEEEYIDTTKIDTSSHWFRLIVKPCFRLPYCFVVEKKAGKTFLAIKITNGDGAYYPGVLVSTTRFVFSDTLYDNISQELNSQKFWMLGEDTTCLGGFDGETWMFEAIEHGKYNILSRWLPQSCGDSTTLRLARIGINLSKLSKLDNILVAIGAPKSDL